MAAISLLSGRVPQVTHDVTPTILTGTAASAVTVGTFGKIGASGIATVSSNTETDGLILKTAAAGNPTSLLLFGKVSGYDVSGMTVGDFVYALEADGTLNTASTNAIAVGKVVVSALEPIGKVILVNCYSAML